MKIYVGAFRFRAGQGDHAVVGSFCVAVCAEEPAETEQIMRVAILRLGMPGGPFASGSKTEIFHDGMVMLGEGTMAKPIVTNIRLRTAVGEVVQMAASEEIDVYAWSPTDEQKDSGQPFVVIGAKLRAAKPSEEQSKP